MLVNAGIVKQSAGILDRMAQVSWVGWWSVANQLGWFCWGRLVADQLGWFTWVADQLGVSWTGSVRLTANWWSVGLARDQCHTAAVLLK
jgi:hypothetical protein